MKKSDSNIWFSAKKHGWGWGFPIKWQGWLVLLAYVGLILKITTAYNPEGSILIWLSYILPLTAIFIAIYWHKGEKLRWRWGKD